MPTETTNYGLTKPGYSDTADVADINENMDKIDGVLNYVSDAIGIVVDGDKTAYADGVEIGQFVVLRNSTITGCDDGLYKAAKTIPYNTVIDSTYLTAEPSGAANALNASLKHILATTPSVSATDVQIYSDATLINNYIVAGYMIYINDIYVLWNNDVVNAITIRSDGIYMNMIGSAALNCPVHIVLLKIS